MIVAFPFIRRGGQDERDFSVYVGGEAALRQAQGERFFYLTFVVSLSNHSGRLPISSSLSINVGTPQTMCLRH
ncbi:MAG: hypothetical protein J4O08_07845, partial [Chloroflexi bacterium]|nr:hypothetical protein [Chloroflexota bacterium]